MSQHAGSSPTSTSAIIALGLGILAVLLAPPTIVFVFQGGTVMLGVHLLIGATAIGFGIRGLQETGPDADLDGHGLALAGVALGVVGIAFWALVLALLLTVPMD